MVESIVWFKNEEEEVQENEKNLVISMLGTGTCESVLRILNTKSSENGNTYSLKI